MTKMMHSYQVDAVKFLTDNERGMLIADPGLGKTRIVLETLADSRVALPALVVAPLQVVMNVWMQENDKWGFDFNGYIWHGKDRTDTFHGAPTPDIIFTNPENLEAILERCFRWGIKTLIVDEQTLFKNPGSGRSKKMRKAAHQFELAWGLTGTPTPRSLENLWSQTMALGLEEVFGHHYFTPWQKEHFYPTDFNQRVWQIFPGHEKILYDAIRPYTKRLRAEDHLRMPLLHFSNHITELHHETRATYKYMNKTGLLPGIVEEPMSRPVLNGRLRQLCTGAVYADSSRDDWVVFDNTKHNRIFEFCQTTDTPKLIAYEYTHQAERLANLLFETHDVEVISGNNTPGEVSWILDRWNDDAVDILLAHPQCVGHGVNMQGGTCTDVLFASPMLDYELYDQFIRRVYRQGQEHPITVHNFIADDTIDNETMASLLLKEEQQQDFLTAIGEKQAAPLPVEILL